jgi:hypothetical protein
VKYVCSCDRNSAHADPGTESAPRDPMRRFETGTPLGDDQFMTMGRMVDELIKRLEEVAGRCHFMH